MTDDISFQGFDPEKIRAGARNTHYIVGRISGFGIALYLLVAALNAYLNALDSSMQRGGLVTTIPTDTALGLLGVAATVLVAFVASLWTTAQFPAAVESAYGRGRRLVLIDVTAVTGVGSVFVGLSGALHGWDKDFNVVVSLTVAGLSVALAYIAADIGEFVRRDRGLNQTLSEFVRQDNLSRMLNARECWLTRSRLVGQYPSRRGLLARLRQNVGCVAVAAALHCVALLVWGDSRDLAQVLAAMVGCVVWSLIVGQLMAHHAAVLFVQRNWLALLMVSLISLLLLAVNASLANSFAVWLHHSVRVPRMVAHASAWSTVFGPLLLCLAGLTVAPNTWRWYRPLAEVRWGIIRAVSRHIDKLSRTESEDPSRGRRGPHVMMLRRLRTAIRTATGVERLESGPAS
jgi:hypothetical protein